MSGMLGCVVVLGLGWMGAAEEVTLAGGDGVQAVFRANDGAYAWCGYADETAARRWNIEGPVFSLQTPDGTRTDLCPPGFSALEVEGEGAEQKVVLSVELAAPRVAVKQTYSFCPDGRTLRISTALRALGDPVTIQRLGLLEIQVPGQTLQRMGPELVSSPVFGDRIFLGVEHPSAWCQVEGDTARLVQHAYAKVGEGWLTLPGVVFGSASDRDTEAYKDEALRRAFLRYLDTVRVKPPDMHVHYNDWWTAPVPSSQEFVLNNIAALKSGLFDTTGFFFDSYALDAGWSDVHSVWEMDTKQFPNGFAPLRAALEEAGGHVGLWISPSSMYPFALDNQWLKSAGYEVTPHTSLGLTACLAKGGKYQQGFKAAALKHARDAALAHMKFDGFVPLCDVAEHGHPVGPESWLPLAEGLMEVFDALRAEHPEIALEPTCFGYQPSPWWLMHTPFIIGPFGDDSPYGRSPCPEYIESMTTARDIENLNGRDKFLMPSSALQCFDLIVQCPGAFQNHAVMAIGRGRWFISSYLNPKFMDETEWRFFAGLMRWAREHRKFLQEPLPIGGNPEDRHAYGYWFDHPQRQIYCVRNPWIQEAEFMLPEVPALPEGAAAWQLRMIYPRRAWLPAIPSGTFPALRLGPYETLMFEAVPVTAAAEPTPVPAAPEVTWTPTDQAALQRIIYEGDEPPLGPSWTALDGTGGEEQWVFEFSGELSVEQARAAELCFLCQGPPEVAGIRCTLTIDGEETPLTVSASKDGFGATGVGHKEHWIWFTAPAPLGRHTLAVKAELPTPDLRVGWYARGTVDAPGSAAGFEDGVQFPVYKAEEAPWSRTLHSLSMRPRRAEAPRTLPRRVERIDGIYLDALDWQEATAGWGEVRRNRSIMDQPMTLGGKTFLRGLGAHAVSRISYVLPEGYAAFAATIGKDQEVPGGSVVFVVELDGREAFRSPVMRTETPAIDINLPLDGAQKLTLIVEDAGDTIAADHADWANACFRK
jgi:hypothetical protein